MIPFPPSLMSWGFFAKISFIERKKKSWSILRKRASIIISTIFLSWCFLQKRFLLRERRAGPIWGIMIPSPPPYSLSWGRLFFCRKIWLWEIKKDGCFVSLQISDFELAAAAEETLDKWTPSTKHRTILVGWVQNKTVFGCSCGERRESTAFVLEWRCERETERERDLGSFQAGKQMVVVTS